MEKLNIVFIFFLSSLIMDRTISVARNFQFGGLRGGVAPEICTQQVDNKTS
jgi:hypothetical protein